MKCDIYYAGVEMYDILLQSKEISPVYWTQLAYNNR